MAESALQKRGAEGAADSSAEKRRGPPGKKVRRGAEDRESALAAQPCDDGVPIVMPGTTSTLVRGRNADYRSYHAENKIAGKSALFLAWEPRSCFWLENRGEMTRYRRTPCWFYPINLATA